jgi:hypothetical protein
VGARRAPFAVARLVLAYWGIALMSCGLVPAGNEAFAGRLGHADGFLLAGDGKLARKELDSLARGAGRDYSRWLSVLKRERALARAGGDSSRYLGKIVTAEKRCGERGAFGFILAEALLSSGDGTGALKALGGAETGGIDADGLAAALGGGGREIALAAALYAIREGGSAPAQADPAVWALLADATGNPGYAINAALSYLNAGDRAGGALYVLEAQRRGGRIDPALAYSCGLYADSARLSGPGGPGPDALAADALYLSGDREGARRLWLERTELPGGGSYTDWLDAATTDPDPVSAMRLLSRSIPLFPQRPELKRALASLAARTGISAAPPSEGTARADGGEAGGRALDDAYIDDWIDCAARMRGEETAKAEADAIKLISAYPARRDIAEFAFLSLLRIGRPESAFRALALHEAGGGKSGSAAAFFAAPFRLLAGGDVQGAADLFREEGAKRADTGASMNAAILLVSLMRETEAIRVLSGSLAFAKPGREKADLFLALGDAYLKAKAGAEDGGRKLAENAFRAALSEDPQDEEASFRLRAMDSSAAQDAREGR